MEERKQKLISALESEKDRLDKLCVDTKDHCITIDFLKTGSYRCEQIELEDYPLLDASVNDYNCLLSDYGV